MAFIYSNTFSVLIFNFLFIRISAPVFPCGDLLYQGLPVWSEVVAVVPTLAGMAGVSQLWG